jgi:hypothetical protein
MKEPKVVKLQAAVTPHLATLLRLLSPDRRRRTVGELLTQHAEAAAAAVAGAAAGAEEAVVEEPEVAAPPVAGPPMGAPLDAAPAASAASVAGAGPSPPDAAAAAAAAAEVNQDAPDGVSMEMDHSVSLGPAAAAVAEGGGEEEGTVESPGDGSQQGPAQLGQGRDMEQEEQQGGEAAGAADLEEQLPAYSDVYPQGSSSEDEEEEVGGGQKKGQEERLEDWEVAAAMQAAEWGNGLDTPSSSQLSPARNGDTDSEGAAAADGADAAEDAEGPPSAASLLQALLDAPSSSSSTAPLDMTGVFDALAAAVAATLEALWELVALRAAALVRHAHGMCPVPGVTLPLEVVEYCQEYAELLLPPVSVGVQGGWVPWGAGVC